MGTDAASLGTAVDALLDRRLTAVSRRAPAFVTALRGYRAARTSGDAVTAAGIAAWLAGQPHIAAVPRRHAGVRGDLDHFGALGFLQGLLAVLRDAGRPGLVLVVDDRDAAADAV